MPQWTKPVRTRLEEEYGPSGGWICVLATADATGRPSARAMVLREIDDEGTLLFVSDRRTRKDTDIRCRPDVEVVFWLPQTNCQIRLRGQAAAVGAEMDDYMRSTWWARLDESNARRVTGEDVEGDHPLPGTFELIVVTPNEVEIDDYREDEKQCRSWHRSGRAWEPAAV